MLDILKNFIDALMGKKAAPRASSPSQEPREEPKIQAAPRPQEPAKADPAPESPTPDAFIQILDECTHIKKEAHAQVLKHLKGEIDLNKTGNKLSADEKRELGLNTRLTITRELVEVLTDSGLAQKNPKEILTDLHTRFQDQAHQDPTA